MKSMYTIDLARAGQGIHEELVAYVADQQDYYAKEGVHVSLRDGTAWNVERLRRVATIGLGRAVVSTMTDGVPWVALSVNTQHPLFWLMGREKFSSVESLKEKENGKARKIGVHGPLTPPGAFERLVLRKHGLDPDRDVECVVMYPGDYTRHLHCLANGSLDAAFVGSTMAPELAAKDNGLRVLEFMGDDLQIPTVGIAVDPTYISPDDPAVTALVRANRRALQTIHDEPELAARYIRALIPRLNIAQAQEHYERYIAPYFSPDGEYDPTFAVPVLSDVAKELGVSKEPDAASFYRTDLPQQKSA